MSSLNLFHPFNIPNLLTPSRGHLEIQYVIFSFIFLSLFGYVAYEFFDISFIIIIVSCIVLFIILYFLYFVLKERDSVDEAVLTSEITEKDVDNEILESNIVDKEAKLLLLQQGDKRNADDENRLKREIREDRLKKLRLERDLASYDQTFVNDVQGIRKSNNGETVQKELQNRLEENKTELDEKLDGLKQKTTARGESGGIGKLKKIESEKKKELEDGKGKLVEAENNLLELETDKEFLDQKKKEAQAEQTAATTEKGKADTDVANATKDTTDADTAFAAAAATATPSEKIDLQNQLLKAREVESKAKAKQREAEAKEEAATAKVTAVNGRIAAKTDTSAGTSRTLDQQVADAKTDYNTAQGTFTTAETNYNTAKRDVITTRKQLETDLKSNNVETAREAAEKLYGETTITPEDRRELDALLKKKEDLEKALDKSRILSGKEDSMDAETAKITLQTNKKRIENYEKEAANLELEKTGITDNTEKRQRDLAALYVKTSDLDEKQRINAEINSLENKRNRELDRLNQKQYDLNLERLELSTQNQSLFQDYKSEIASKESEKKARDLRNAYDEEYRNFEKDSDRLAAYYKLKARGGRTVKENKQLNSLEREMTIVNGSNSTVELNQRYKNIEQRAHDRAEASKKLANKIQGADVKNLSKEHLRLLEDYINDRQIEGKEADVSTHIAKRDLLRNHLRQKILGVV